MVSMILDALELQLPSNFILIIFNLRHMYIFVFHNKILLIIETGSRKYWGTGFYVQDFIGQYWNNYMEFLRCYYPSSAWSKWSQEISSRLVSMRDVSPHDCFTDRQFCCENSSRATVQPREIRRNQVCCVFFPEAKIPAVKLSRSKAVVRRDLPS